MSMIAGLEFDGSDGVLFLPSGSLRLKVILDYRCRKGSSGWGEPRILEMMASEVVLKQTEI